MNPWRKPGHRGSERSSLSECCCAGNDYVRPTILVTLQTNQRWSYAFSP
jgi:hypothetical protein